MSKKGPRRHREMRPANTSRGYSSRVKQTRSRTYPMVARPTWSGFQYNSKGGVGGTESWSLTGGSTPMAFTNFVTLGSNNRDWRRLIAEGASATTSLNGRKAVLHLSPGFFDASAVQVGQPPASTVGAKVWYYGSGNFFQGLNFPGVPGGVSLATLNQAKGAFLQRAQQVHTKLKGMTVAGEFGKTLSMIKQSAIALRYREITRYLDALQKERKRMSPRYLKKPKSQSWDEFLRKHKRKVISETWLEYSYGWKPLISDIRDGAKAVSEIANQTVHPLDEMVSVSISNSSQLSRVADQFTSGPVVLNYTKLLINKETCKFYGKVYVTIPNAYQPPDQLLGFSVQEFVPTVWELIPYSFLVDYFTNIGDLLSAYSYGTSSVRWVTQTTVNDYSFKVVDPQFVWPSWSGIYRKETELGVPGSAEWVVNVVTRAPYIPSDLYPSFRFEVPGMGSTKWLNIAALARTHSSLIPF